MHKKTVQLGGYSGCNNARDFLRGVKPPVVPRLQYVLISGVWGLLNNGTIHITAQVFCLIFGIIYIYIYTIYLSIDQI